MIFYPDLLIEAVSKELCHRGRSTAKIRNLLIFSVQFSADGGRILNQVQDAMTGF